jgi:hypothetical protein
MVNWWVLRLLRALLAVGLAVGAPAALFATPATCHAGGPLGESLEAVAAEPQRWSCGPARQSLEDERVYLRFEIARDGQRPVYLETRRAALEAIHLRVVDRSGEVRTASIAPEHFRQSPRGGFLRVPLPETGAAPAEVIAAIDRPTHAMTLEQARLSPADSTASVSVLVMTFAPMGPVKEESLHKPRNARTVVFGPPPTTGPPARTVLEQPFLV